MEYGNILAEVAGVPSLLPEQHIKGSSLHEHPPRFIGLASRAFSETEKLGETLGAASGIF